MKQELYVGSILLILLEAPIFRSGRMSHYHFLQEYGKEIADTYLEMYSTFVVPITNTSIKKGMEFKLQYKKERLSYVDCIGYALALELGIQFLTGDQKFASKDNVAFVK